MKKQNTLKLNLQLFADDAGVESNAANEQNSVIDTKSFDELLKNKDYQAEFDRRVTKALNTAKESWSAETAKQVAEAKSEAEKLAKMTAEQKAAHAHEQKLKELEDREAKLTYRELRAEAQGLLSEKGLPAELIAGVNLSSADACTMSVEALDKAFRLAVQNGVEDRLRSTNQPKTSGAGSAESSYMEQLRLAAGLHENKN